jgi:putative sigma-54 modulation protein
MKIRITHKGIKLSEKTREFIEEKCEKLERFSQIVGEVGVILKVESSYIWFAEINVPIKGTLIHGEAKTDDLLSSFEEALSRVERQMKKRRDKIVDHNKG